MGVGRLQVFRRKRILGELKALFIALWHLALQKSFPVDGSLIFEEFLARFENTKGAEKYTRPIVERAKQYVDLLERKRDTDFSEVASHLASLLDISEAEARTLKLRLALHIRSTYTLIFQRLI